MYANFMIHSPHTADCIGHDKKKTSETLMQCGEQVCIYL